jgi:hypothetical protein
MKVAELSGALLDYWVAKAEGIEHPRAMREMAPGFVMVPYESEDDEGPITRYRTFEPSSSWADGGPILGRLLNQGYVFMQTDVVCPVRCLNAFGAMDGSTPLESAMRAFVHGRFGTEVPDAA